VVSLLIYIIANVLLAAVPANLVVLFILRIVQGFGAASVLSLGAGTVADMTEPKERASALSIVLLGPQMGPVLGPLIGGAIAGSVSWRWTFGFLGMCDRSLLTLHVLISVFCSHHLLCSVRPPRILSS
jgi:MFS family permease